MSNPDVRRAMWLLNHSTLRAFEVPQLKLAGFQEVFLPKSFPYDEGNLSASVSFAEDASLSLSPDEIEVLNAADWYGGAGQAAWDIANKHFQLLFLAFFPAQLDDALRNFRGTIVLRAFGLSAGVTYTQLVYEHLGPSVVERIRGLRDRFWFGAGYEHLHVGEAQFIAARACYLPVGLADRKDTTQWTGDDRQILFICPRIATSPYYENIYKDFKKNFGDLPHIIGGAQPIAVSDSSVAGFIPDEAYARMMYGSRVMYYHSREPNHLHYHPIEAMRSGMPVIYMEGGLLDRLAGKLSGQAPAGRARNVAEARKKVRRILDGDAAFTASVQNSQIKLPEKFSSAALSPRWQSGIAPVVAATSRVPMSAPAKKKRIGVILPIEYRGGTLRAAKYVANALLIGSQQDGAETEIVFAYRGDNNFYKESEFSDLNPGIRRRAFNWKELNYKEAKNVMSLRGHASWRHNTTKYCMPIDGAADFIECDAWVIVSDRQPCPMLPLKPIIVVIYDYLQRYF
ncbi:MAG: hypothetical protein HC777_00475 [Hyphomonadaceae bacterium]|nr:hypothetical protein [Hyphomonadaceae bacterium]